MTPTQTVNAPSGPGGEGGWGMPYMQEIRPVGGAGGNPPMMSMSDRCFHQYRVLNQWYAEHDKSTRTYATYCIFCLAADTVTLSIKLNQPKP